jgi:outer membrane protein OmpA-like peptidoglycan-associated protein
MSITCRFTVVPAVLLSAVLVAGCTTNPYTGEQQASKAGVGAGIGAATGALAGQLIGGNTTATLVGAGIGGLVGGVIGDSMDQQEAALRQQLQGTGVSVQRVGNDIKLIMPGNITFATDSSDIKSNFFSVLNSVAIVLKKYTYTTVNVAGFTDNTGNANYNQQLSERRAASVATYLQSQGVSAGRFAVVGYGERYPIASNSTAQGREQNRRVEITLQSTN